MAPPRDNVVHDTLPRPPAAGQYLTRCGLSPAPLLKGHGSTPSLQLVINVGHRQQAVSVPHAQSYLTSAFLIPHAQICPRIPLALYTSRFTRLSRQSVFTYLPPHIFPPHISRSLAQKKKTLPQKAVSPRATPRTAPPPSSRPRPHPPPGDPTMRTTQTLPAPSPPPYSPNRWRSSPESADYFGRANPTTLQHQQRPQLFHPQQVYFHTPPCGHRSTPDPLPSHRPHPLQRSSSYPQPSSKPSSPGDDHPGFSLNPHRGKGQ